MKSKSPSKQPIAATPKATLTPLDPESLRWQMQEVQLAIARRAYELFEGRGQEHGHDWEDWFQAESELLRPVSVSVSESDDRISVRANVLGFEPNELNVGIEARCLTIFGKKEISAMESEGGKVEYIDWYPDQILSVIDLETEILPENSVVELDPGLLKFELPKAGKLRAAAA